MDPQAIDVADLTELQRELIEVLTVAGAPDASFDVRGMPLEREERQAWLDARGEGGKGE